MISPRAVIRDRRIAVPHVHAWHAPAVPRGWRRLSPSHLLWLAIWAPWWVGNELPPPPPPRSGEADMADPPAGTPGAWLLDTMDDLKFRFGLVWTVALILRGAWLGGVAGIGWLLLGLIGVVASPEPRELAILVGAGAVLGVVLRIFHRPRYAQIALLLERAFDLRSRLSTAVAGLRFDASGESGLHRLQLADAANALDRARTQLRPIHWVPIREIFLGLIVGLALLLLMVAQRPEGEIDAASRAGVPPFVPVSERLAAAREQAVPPELPDPATLQEMQDISRTSNQAREDLETIGAALQVNTITAPAGDAITNEDYAGANQQLDESAEDVTRQSQEEREALADELDEAGDQVSEQNPELAESAHRAADDVRSGEDSGGLGDLGDQIEQTGEDVISQQSDGGELTESQSSQQSGSESGSAGGDSAQASQPQAGEQGSGETQASSQGDPGSGMSASAGTGESEEGSSSSQGEGGEGDQQASSGSSERGRPGDAQSDGAGQSQEGQPGGESEAGGGNTSGSPNEEGASSQGSGAGGGERNANDPTQEGGSGGEGGDLAPDEQAPEAGQGEAGDPPPGGGSDEGDDQAGTAGGGSSIKLPGTSDERVRSGSDIGASSVGSGGGVGAASGDSSGSASGSTGPDPNTVPARWRVVVEDYFREGGSP